MKVKALVLSLVAGTYCLRLACSPKPTFVLCGTTMVRKAKRLFR